MDRKKDVLREELARCPHIQDMTFSQQLPYSIRSGGRFASWEGKEDLPEVTLGVYRAWIDYDFFDFYGIPIVKGRNFSKDFPSDVNEAYIINETAAKYIGWKDPIGQKFGWSGKMDGKIIGVVRDFHFLSLHLPIDGLAVRLKPGGGNILSIKVSPVHVQEALIFLEEKCTELSPNYPFSYRFLDEGLERYYMAEMSLGRSFNYFTFVAVFIACLGLFGMASYTTERRTREIGIRKVLGASVSSITALLGKDFLRWVVAANLIAWPVAYIGTTLWLRNYAYRVVLKPWIFLISGGIALAVALMTVVYQTLKAARTNPVNSLRYE
jgi:putative ABC transport system permease protein